MDIAARTSQLFEILESQEFDELESLLAADANMKQTPPFSRRSPLDRRCLQVFAIRRSTFTAS